MITFRNVSLRRGPHVLLKHLNWTIYPKQHIGVIGANGAGKTSLFSLILNQLHVDVGDLEIVKQIKIAYVAQETPSLPISALNFVLDGDDELRALEGELKKAELNHDGMGIAHLHEKLSIIDAYTAKARAAQLLNGLGFSEEEQLQPVGKFSGGWRVRLNLAKALMCRSDLLLLDEPTNHLDLDAVLWLEQWLKKYSGTLLIISHDRDFLDGIVDHIAYIYHQNLKVYSGNYSSFEKQHADELLLQHAMYEKQQKKIAHLQSFINRFRAKASKAKQAQSRIKAIERMDLVCAVQGESPFEFEFRELKQCPNPLITLENANIAYDDRIILEKLNLSISPSDRIAILGPNGAGKSSLIKLLAGVIEPSLGKRETSSGLKIGYFAQHQVDELQLHETPLEHLKRLAEKETEQHLRTFLGGFGFTGESVFKSIAHFSGGEKSRLALALLVWQRPNLLLLDEPTNHLDLEMRQALSIALQDYQGAMLLVSHDRFLVRTTTDKLLLVAYGRLNDFDGDLQDYQRWLLEFRKQQTLKTERELPKNKISKKEKRKLSYKEQKELESLPLSIEKLEKKQVALQEFMASQEFSQQTRDKIAEIFVNLNKIEADLESAYLRWQELDNLKKFFDES